MPVDDLRKLLTTLESQGVNWRDVASRVASADVAIQEFIQYKAGSSLSALAAVEPNNAAFEIQPRAFARPDQAQHEPEPGTVPGAFPLAECCMVATLNCENDNHASMTKFECSKRMFHVCAVD
jgi:hypothetical protein